MKLPIVRLLIALSATAAGASQPLDGFAVAPGLEASLYAGTEEISSPVSIDVDDRGRVWVFETVNYRKKTRSTGDRILILEDTNGDGHADSQKLFYEGSDINGGSGICVLGNRVIVSAPDRILILIDTDGDDKSDTKNLLFQAPVTKKWSVAGQHDHALHSFQFGPDGRLYFNFGDATEKLRDADNKIVIDRHGYPVVAAAGFLRAGRKPGEYTNEQPMGGMVLRCELDGSNVEVLGHNFRNNWEVTADSFGSLWQSDNDNGSSSCRVNFVMEYGNFGYLDEMSGAVYKVHRTNMSPNITRSMWHQNDPGVVPNMLITGSGAPAGIQVYEGDLLPAQYRNQILLAEPYRNALWSIPVTKRGAGYSAKIVNILQTPKSKLFRPCDISIAPDGSLFVADWFDPIVCCHKGKDDRGRIYRVAPNGHKYVPSTFDYKTATGAIVALRSPNLAARYKAWTALTAMGRTARPISRRSLQKMPIPVFVLGRCGFWPQSIAILQRRPSWP
jgi:putative membrane-bound dehydrogenase-like protein